jgi:His-Xaa-Ser system protein HxsD
MERVLRLDTRDTTVTAIRAAAYRFGNIFSVAIEPPGLATTDVVTVRCIFGASVSGEDADGAVAEFLRELNDQVLREHVREETKNLRAAIIAHAFSRTTLGRDG